MKEIKVFSPASVSNICCGFDVLGFAMEGLGDIISLKKIDRKGVFIKNGTGFKIPLDIEKNTATVALKAFLDKLDYSHGFEISIEKNIKPGSGLGRVLPLRRLIFCKLWGTIYFTSIIEFAILEN